MSSSFKSLGVVPSPPQTRPLPGQIANHAGGYAFAADDWSKLNRFLITGIEGGSFYTGEPEMASGNADTVRRLIILDGVRVVQRIVEVSEGGLAPKNDPALFALALAASIGDTRTKRVAFRALPRVARTATHLFHFAGFVQRFRGWGRELRHAVQNWYTAMPVDRLALQAVKYKARDGWSHGDLLRLSHPKTEEAARDAVFRYMLGGLPKVRTTERVRRVGDRIEAVPVPDRTADLPDLIAAAEVLAHAETAARAVPLIRQYRLPRECVPTPLLNDREVWAALADTMPITATLRNLAKMTSVGLLAPLAETTRTVCQRIADGSVLRQGRVHPIAVLAALMTYRQGHGERGSLTWKPVQQVIDALDAGFYAAFGAVEPTGKALMLALDVSGSMSWGTIAGIPGLTPRIAAAAMALVTANVETNALLVGFSGCLTELAISPRMRLDEAVRVIAAVPMGLTDCSLPMEHAIRENLPVDGFAVLTDSETYAGSRPPAQALQAYRQHASRDARLAVNAMLANDFTLADPADRGMADFVGFSTATPDLMSAFFRGDL
jgi:60 kDa SS-A/Ro ribonucleoprotein